MKKILSTTLALLSVFLLCSCIRGAPPPEFPLRVSIKIPSDRKATTNSQFPILVGIGQISSCDYAILEITAEGFEITDPLGNSATDTYQHLYSDFGDTKYHLNNLDEPDPCRFFETFLFQYAGDDPGSGIIIVSLKTLLYNEAATGEEERYMEDGGEASAALGYTVEDGQVRFLR